MRFFPSLGKFGRVRYGTPVRAHQSVPRQKRIEHPGVRTMNFCRRHLPPNDNRLRSPLTTHFVASTVSRSPIFHPRSVLSRGIFHLSYCDCSSSCRVVRFRRTIRGPNQSILNDRALVQVPQGLNRRVNSLQRDPSIPSSSHPQPSHRCHRHGYDITSKLTAFHCHHEPPSATLPSALRAKKFTDRGDPRRCHHSGAQNQISSSHRLASRIGVTHPSEADTTSLIWVLAPRYIQQ
jgi:hypothetical protein